MKIRWIVSLCLLSAASVAYAATAFVRPGQVRDAMAAWHPVDVRSGGVSRITGARPDAHGGLGSLEQWLPNDSAADAQMEVLAFDLDPDPVYGLRPAAGGFGLLSLMTELSFDWYRDSASSAWPHLTPAFRVTVFDPDVGYYGATYTFVWEGVYNGYASLPGLAVPTDQWVHADLTQDFFWRIPVQIDGQWVGPSYCSQNPSECYVFNRGLSDWGLGPAATIVGLNVGVGSGWNGDFHAFADHVTLDFVWGPRTTWDFEPDGGANP